MSTLYLVATPIGNLEDMSPRAVQTLRQVQLIAAEDTRHTLKLLNHFDIHKRLLSYHEHNKVGQIDQVLNALELGDVALVSDAGTPALNDPGYELVKAALQAGYQVSSIPGPCAPIAALVASGLPTDSFLFLGYLPRKKTERAKALLAVQQLPYTLIFLEAPHRLLDSLASILEILGERQVAIARELTKLHEEIVRGSITDAITHFNSYPPRGEFTLVLSGAPEADKLWSETELQVAFSSYDQKDLSPSRLAGELAARSGWSKREVYRWITERQTTHKDKENGP